MRDVYIEEMENAAFALRASGDVSEVVDTVDGFYVLVRMEYDEVELERQANDLLSSYQWANTERIKECFRDSVTFEWLEELDYFTIE